MIRVADRGDVEAVYRLIRQLSHHDFTKEQFENCFFDTIEEGRVLVYETENLVCGCLVFAIHYPLQFSRKTAEIVNLIVDENSRNCGIGKRLIDSFERIAIENDCVRIDVASANRRKDAHRFYEREGFLFTHHKFTKEL